MPQHRRHIVTTEAKCVLSLDIGNGCKGVNIGGFQMNRLQSWDVDIDDEGGDAGIFCTFCPSRLVLA